jgi:predicted dehydrogenase
MERTDCTSGNTPSQPNENATSMTRRSFMPAVGSAIAAITIVPRHVLGGAGYRAPSDKLNIAAVGVGGVGASYVKGCESENIAAFADVDHSLAAKTFALYPKARTYRDFRVLFDKERNIDAVIIGTPDHSHAVIAMAAIQLGKAVYVAKPMTRTIYETRAITKAARERKVATQMSVQSCASDPACRTAEWVQSGVIGQVREAHVWSDRPIWPQWLARPAKSAPVPRKLDWDLWLGPAPQRPYHPIYHPFNFRGWVDFGTGALGDMALHSFHVVFTALKLTRPSNVEASNTVVMLPALHGDSDKNWTRSRKAQYPETFPHSSIVSWDFPARDGLPPVRLNWYDGGLKPPRPQGLDASEPWGDEGLMFVGDKGVLLSGFTGGPRLVTAAQKAAFNPPPKTFPRSLGHYQEWISASKGGPPANCNFEFASLIAETALLGVIAQRTGKFLVWDAENMRIPNDAAANELISSEYRRGWSL